MMETPQYAIPFPAPAKLNLDLRIIGRREDGYHLLESIFCLVGLYDTVYLSVRNQDSRIILHNPADGIPEEQDLTYRAARDLQIETGIKLGVDIWLDKKIPTGGGLGGGSSDAATVLLALNKLWKCGLPTGKLMSMGLKLGADVPFFIFGKNAFVQGIGEHLSEIAVPKQWYVIVRPNVHVSTVKIFANERLTRDSKPSIMPTFQAIQPFRNDMQAVVLENYPEVLEVFKYLKSFGKPLMTGSGSCLFLSFSSRQEAKTVYSQVSNIYETYCVEGLSLHPMFGI
ncbi:4-(cytidine 5'-diphospho)-2-C-methyl-D-erythritol kinase [Neisseria weaveri]|uniref:4-(cytidine 5'-diphospho)-2-C-methyl-D-erythritol kinase n=1 Tax=Neisseria weaveri TaxID=28091 RepID=UPI000D2FD49E|nr:4-(cytidine 5'-diphospho)-2-C-methyl-D-erythritol kinase [Neisseria weaveri]